MRISIICLIFLAACQPAIETRSDFDKWCDSWHPRPPQCDAQGFPQGWSPAASAPLMEWIYLLTAQGRTLVGFQSEPGTFLVKDTYQRVYPVAWKKID